MLAINRSDPAAKVTPNLLPCAIKHNGPVNAAERYWKPEVDKDGHDTAYFRGRKLRGKTVQVPEGYSGVVLEKTDQVLIRPKLPSIVDVDDELDEDAEDRPIETKVMNQKGAFDKVIVWGHESLPADDDAYVRGIHEWIQFAQKVSLLLNV